MTKTMRLTLTTALALALAGPALAETTWRMATKMPVDSPEGQVFAKFAELTEEYTDGELKIDVFPNEQLGKEDAVLEQLQANIIQVYAEGFGYMKKWEPALAWVAAAFAFDDYDHWQRFMTSETVTGWFDNAAEQSGVRPLGDPTQVLRGPPTSRASSCGCMRTRWPSRPGTTLAPRSSPCRGPRSIRASPRASCRP